MRSIAIDIYGGDFGPRCALKACLKSVKSYKDLHLVIPLLDADMLWAERYFAKFGDRIKLLPCDLALSNNSTTSDIIRRSRHSSMAIALQVHADGKADGVLSIGNTGALMMLSKRILGNLQGMQRPALAKQLPTKGRPLLMLDLGANLAASSELLTKWSLLAIAWYRAQGIDKPEVALLNVGTEDTKGPSQVREAATILSNIAPECFSGFAEGYGLFDGELDALICDGFSGNVALKTIEGLADWLTDMVSDELGRIRSMKWLLPIWKHALRRIRRRLSPRVQGGAVLLGISGNVFKTHGNSDQKTIEHAITYALDQVKTTNISVLDLEFSELQKRLIVEQVS